MDGEASEPAAIEYIGVAGVTAPCLKAIYALLMFQPKIKRVIILTVPGTPADNGFLVEMEGYRYVAVKSGFGSNYAGEGSRGFSKALLVFDAYGCDIDEVEISAALMKKINQCRLLESELERLLGSAGWVRPWSDYVFDKHWDLRDTGRLWLYAPLAMPYALLDPRLHDIAREFWNDPDAALMKAFRRLEHTIRERTGLEGQGRALCSNAFLGKNPPLQWSGIDNGEREGRANLFTGAFGAYRNPRNHREPEHDDGPTRSHVTELVLVSELFRLEARAVDHPSSD
ncbi:MAG: TIGR02391 family protein [Thermoplasmatota archaeon]